MLQALLIVSIGPQRKAYLFCPPPRGYPKCLHVGERSILIIYVAGITEADLLKAQALDDQKGDLAGAKALYEKLGIATTGIRYLAKIKES